jgi:hypothetical protein
MAAGAALGVVLARRLDDLVHFGLHQLVKDTEVETATDSVMTLP